MADAAKQFDERFMTFTNGLAAELGIDVAKFGGAEKFVAGIQRAFRKSGLKLSLFIEDGPKASDDG